MTDQTVKNLFYPTAIVALLLIYSGCEHAGPFVPPNPDATFSSIQTNIIDPGCAFSGCHLGVNAPFGLDLSSDVSYENLTTRTAGSAPTVPYVDPGNPDGSYLIQVLEGSPSINVARMPFGRPPLPVEQIQSIRDWISDGAEDN